MEHFQAWDPITKVIVADITSNATSSAAAKFLYKVIKELPFKLKSIQADWGSEFMKDLEQACQRLSISFYILPPKWPHFSLNGLTPFAYTNSILGASPPSHFL